MKKILMIIGGVVVVLVVSVVAIIFFVSSTSEKLVCKSAEGDITLMYDDDSINGYTAKGGMSYELDQQQELAKQIGIEAYLDQFEYWFTSNTTGSCER